MPFPDITLATGEELPVLDASALMSSDGTTTDVKTPAEKLEST
jgi:hypothetical protein